MHLFLTSSPCEDNVPEGVQLPCIYFERNGFVENLRDRMKGKSRLLVIAADPHSYGLNEEMANTFANCFRYHGMQISDVEICDDRTSADIAGMVERADVILLGGGHVPTENRFFEEMGLRELMEGFEGVVMGVSAGSMNCAETVYAQPEMPGESIDPEYQRFIPGLALTDVNILPHYQKARYMRLDDKWLYDEVTYLDSVGHEFIAIVDGSYVLVENGVKILFGEGYLLRDGRMERICEDGEAVEL